MKFNHWIVLALVLFTVSCNSIFVKRIDNKSIVLIGPVDHLETKTASTTFWWQVLSGADQYRLQIVSTSFDSVKLFVLDSVITSDKFTIQLNPGRYQWRIRGENSAYQTPYSTRSIIIDSTSDLSVQTLLIVSPSDNYFSNQTLVHFKWTPFSFADNYHFEVASPDFTNGPIYSVDVTTDTTSYIFPVGKYQWRVRAQNASSNTPYATRSILIDTLTPLAPQLIAPLNDSVVRDSVKLFWSHGAFTAIDCVFIYRDSMITAPINTMVTKTDSALYITAVPGSYYWRVRSVDSANNVSPNSTIWKFIHQ